MKIINRWRKKSSCGDGLMHSRIFNGPTHLLEAKSAEGLKDVSERFFSNKPDYLYTCLLAA